MTSEECIAIIRAERILRAPQSEEEHEWYAALLDGSVWNPMQMHLRHTERRLGIGVNSALHLTISRTLCRAALEAANDDLRSLPLASLENHTLEPFWDGYVLARQLGGVEFGQRGKGLIGKSALAGFCRRVTSAGRAAQHPVLATVIEQLSPEWMKPVAPDAGVNAKKALTIAFAAGMLLAAHEHSIKHPLLEPLQRATAKKREPAEAANHVSMDEALLGAVLAAPTEDEPRLVLADWLTSRGDPRGEFIQIQCALGRSVIGTAMVTTRPKHIHGSATDLKERETQLLEKYGARWGVEETPALKMRRWQRGFVDAGQCSAADFVATLPILARYPLRHVKISGLTPSLADSMLSASHPTVRFVDLSANRINANRMKIFGAPLFSEITWLNLAENDLSDTKAAAKLAAHNLKVTQLWLSWTGLTDAGLKALSGAAWFSGLTYLSIAGSSVEALGLTYLERATSLTALDLRERGIREEQVRALLEFAPPSLVELVLMGDCDPGCYEQLRSRFTLKGVDATGRIVQ